jgi:uncharacterized membrane protein
MGGMSQPAAAVRVPADAVAQNIETIVRLEDAALHRRTWADVLADNIAEFTGTIWFVALHLVWFGAWAAVNTGMVRMVPQFDPYPFQLLCMIVSMEGVLLATFVLIKQNRMSYLSDRRAHLDLQINLLAEREITRLLRLTNEIGQKLQVHEKHAPGELVADTEVDVLMQEIDRRLNDGD